jgi:hypothetical protein
VKSSPTEDGFYVDEMVILTMCCCDSMSTLAYSCRMCQHYSCLIGRAYTAGVTYQSHVVYVFPV